MEKEEARSAVIVHADKTVLKITGLSIRGLNTGQLEKLLQEKLQSMVRVIGVTGTSLEMDVYDLAAEDILKNEQGFIETVSLCDGILATEVAAIASAERIVEIDWHDIPSSPGSACLRERILEITGRKGERHE